MILNSLGDSTIRNDDEVAIECNREQPAFFPTSLPLAALYMVS